MDISYDFGFNDFSLSILKDLFNFSISDKWFCGFVHLSHTLHNFKCPVSVIVAKQ